MKRRAAFDQQQLGFTFEPALPAEGDGALAGLERFVASSISQMLKDDPRSRFEIAGGVSAFLYQDVSKAMLDAYSAESKDGHNISVARFLALIAETQRYDILDLIVRRIGCTLVVGEEVFTVELGHIQTQIDRLQARQKVLKGQAPPIRSMGGRRK